MHPSSTAPGSQGQSAPAPTREQGGGRTPWVSYVVLGGSVAMFAFELLVLGEDAKPLLLYGPYVARGDWWRVLSMVFEHGNAFHLVMNMSVVWTMGRVYESALGSGRFAVLSLASAIGGSLAVLLFAFASPTVGASGMILGWVGAILPVATKAHRKDLGTWLIQIVLISLIPGVSWQGHLGGFVGGLACGGLLRLGPRYFRYGAPVVVFLLAVATVVVTRSQAERLLAP